MLNIQQQTSDDRFLVIALKQDDKQAFTRLFHAYYKDLVLFGGTYIPEKSTCEDIVQNIFLKLWNDRKTLEIENSLKSYLLLLSTLPITTNKLAGISPFNWNGTRNPPLL